MNRWTDKLRAFNTEWNDLPRKLLTIVIILACLFLALFAFPYIAPFVLAALFSCSVNPIITFLTKLCGGKKGIRNLFSAIIVVPFAGIMLTLLFLLVGRIFEEIKALAIALPGWLGTAFPDVLEWIDGRDLDCPGLQNGVEKAAMR